MRRADRLFQIVQHLMSVIGPHGNRSFFFIHEMNDLANNTRHIGITAEMLRFIKISLIIAFCISKVKKVNPASEFFDHADDVIIRTCTI